jgi:hypothetical protein
VKHGHSKRCWCMLVGKTFLYFKAPTDQVNHSFNLLSSASLYFPFHVSIGSTRSDQHARRPRRRA